MDSSTIEHDPDAPARAARTRRARMRPHVLFRHFDVDGRLLYVGITANLSRRTREHRKASAWYDKVASTRTEDHRSFYLARDAELLAILTESPAYNRALTHGLPIGVTLSRKEALRHVRLRAFWMSDYEY